jgi:ubiquinone/menaquinone biosynthesis C-methylase UbiE
VSAYENLAFSYDELTYDIPYEKILTFWETLLARYRVQPQSVLDLACGTGSLSVLLAERGYRVLGLDCSEQMLTMAQQKADSLAENRPFFICQPMQRLRLYEPVDAAVCCLDSVNYLTRPQDCRETFRRVYDALNAGGVFVFDINTPFKLRSLDGQIFLDDREDVYCVWRAAFDEPRNRCRYEMDIFRRQGSAWQRSQEEHLEYAYTPAELEEYLRGAGFTDIRMYGDRKLRRPRGDELRVWFAARKEQP